MISPIFRTLLVKDICFVRKHFLIYILAGLVGIGFMCIPGHVMGTLGSMVLVTAVMVFYCHLVMKNVVLERKEKNLLFLMTLPISVRSYSFSKLLSSLVVFMAYWVLMLAFIGLFALYSDNYPAVFLAWFLSVFFMFIPGFCIILAVALITGSEIFTIITLVLCNILISAFCNVSFSIPDIAHAYGLGTMAEVGIIWPASIFTIIAIDLVVALITLFLTSLAIYRKTDFI